LRDKAIVTSISPQGILVTPLLTDTCISCAESSCAKRGRPFPVDNPRNFPITTGSVVSVSARASATVAQGFFSLCFPLAAAVGGFFAVGPLALALGHTPTEGLKALGVLLGLGAAVAIVVVSGRVSSGRRARAEISAVAGGMTPEGSAGADITR
jgi:hypothetical protein